MIALADRINDALPQTQCTRCGFPDCKAYAQAIALDNVPINQCPPGGFEGVTVLSKITGRPLLPLNPENGREGPMTVAVVGAKLFTPQCLNSFWRTTIWVPKKKQLQKRLLKLLSKLRLKQLPNQLQKPQPNAR